MQALIASQVVYSTISDNMQSDTQRSFPDWPVDLSTTKSRFMPPNPHYRRVTQSQQHSDLHHSHVTPSQQHSDPHEHLTPSQRYSDPRRRGTPSKQHFLNVHHSYVAPSHQYSDPHRRVTPSQQYYSDPHRHLTPQQYSAPHRLITPSQQHSDPHRHITPSQQHSDSHRHITPSQQHSDPHRRITPCQQHSDPHRHITPSQQHSDSHRHVTPSQQHSDPRKVQQPLKRQRQQSSVPQISGKELSVQKSFPSYAEINPNIKSITNDLQMLIDKREEKLRYNAMMQNLNPNNIQSHQLMSPGHSGFNPPHPLQLEQQNVSVLPQHSFYTSVYPESTQVIPSPMLVIESQQYQMTRTTQSYQIVQEVKKISPENQDSIHASNGRALQNSQNPLHTSLGSLLQEADKPSQPLHSQEVQHKLCPMADQYNYMPLQPWQATGSSNSQQFSNQVSTPLAPPLPISQNQVPVIKIHQTQKHLQPLHPNQTFSCETDVLPALEQMPEQKQQSVCIEQKSSQQPSQTSRMHQFLGSKENHCYQKPVTHVHSPLNNNDRSVTSDSGSLGDVCVSNKNNSSPSKKETKVSRIEAFESVPRKELLDRAFKKDPKSQIRDSRVDNHVRLSMDMNSMLKLVNMKKTNADSEPPYSQRDRSKNNNIQDIPGEPSFDGSFEQNLITPPQTPPIYSHLTSVLDSSTVVSTDMCISAETVVKSICSKACEEIGLTTDSGEEDNLHNPNTLAFPSLKKKLLSFVTKSGSQRTVCSTPVTGACESKKEIHYMNILSSQSPYPNGSQMEMATSITSATYSLEGEIKTQANVNDTEPNDSRLSFDYEKSDDIGLAIQPNVDARFCTDVDRHVSQYVIKERASPPPLETCNPVLKMDEDFVKTEETLQDEIFSDSFLDEFLEIPEELDYSVINENASETLDDIMEYIRMTDGKPNVVNQLITEDQPLNAEEAHSSDLQSEESYSSDGEVTNICIESVYSVTERQDQYTSDSVLQLSDEVLPLECSVPSQSVTECRDPPGLNGGGSSLQETDSSLKGISGLPSNCNHLVIHLQIDKETGEVKEEHKIPEECPMCYVVLCPSSFVVNTHTFAMRAVCGGCGLTIIMVLEYDWELSMNVQRPGPKCKIRRPKTELLRRYRHKRKYQMT